jgi:hypothetical protein
VTNTAHGKPRRNEDIAFKFFVLGRAPVRIAEDENLTLPRVNQILTAYGMQVLGAPPGYQRPLKALKAWAERNCIKNNALVPYRR